VKQGIKLGSLTEISRDELSHHKVFIN